jgi:hypothetical protein
MGDRYMTQCKSCKEEIVWVDMPSGKKMPLDAQPHQAIQVKDGIGAIITVYTPHWASCPGADKFRKKP